MLKEKIREDLKKALMEKRELEVSTLRMLNAAILNKEKEKRYQLKAEKDTELLDEEIIEVIFSETKKRKEAILEFEKGARPDLVSREQQELEVLQKYLPEPLSEEEIQKLAKEAIEKTGAKEIKDIGKVMAELIPKIKGRVEGSRASEVVKEFLGLP